MGLLLKKGKGGALVAVAAFAHSRRVLVGE